MSAECFYCAGLTDGRQPARYVVRAHIEGYEQERLVCGEHLDYLRRARHVNSVEELLEGQ